MHPRREEKTAKRKNNDWASWRGVGDTGRGDTSQAGAAKERSHKTKQSPSDHISVRKMVLSRIGPEDGQSTFTDGKNVLSFQGGWRRDGQEDVKDPGKVKGGQKKQC